ITHKLLGHSRCNPEGLVNAHDVDACHERPRAPDPRILVRELTIIGTRGMWVSEEKVKAHKCRERAEQTRLAAEECRHPEMAVQLMQIADDYENISRKWDAISHTHQILATSKRLGHGNRTSPALCNSRDENAADSRSLFDRHKCSS